MDDQVKTITGQSAGRQMEECLKHARILASRPNLTQSDVLLAAIETIVGVAKEVQKIEKMEMRLSTNKEMQLPPSKTGSSIVVEIQENYVLKAVFKPEDMSILTDEAATKISENPRPIKNQKEADVKLADENIASMTDQLPPTSASQKD
ncbi:Hypothetical predicted protein [Mytilus galloprovincialis]|uniref:Uncharacterized protein n=1 Tax=Mytilus galloprovincialis TaxID=29158 RepID=A0A8B6FWM3_MYTGA|nr:Hypothetical predicted protein [Mytilus galloprovincialis]